MTQPAVHGRARNSGKTLFLEAAAAVTAWNSEYLVGQEVEVILDNGEKLRTRTRSPAWNLESGDAVILVEGIAGGYLLERVRAC